MATVYSLICFGGRTGKTVSLSASTDVVTLTNHGLRNGTKLWPSGTLPSELNTSTPVYARSTAANTFTLHTSSAGAIANTGQILFAGSSTFAAVVLQSDLVASPSTALAAYGLSDLSRWGASGSERIYDGIVSWNSSRSTASPYDVEVAEIGESFNEYLAATLTVNVPAARIKIETRINDIRTPGYHGGLIDAGYVLIRSVSNSNRTGTVPRYGIFDGWTLKHTNAGFTPDGFFLGFSSIVRSMVIIGVRASSGFGLSVTQAGATAEYCISIGWAQGFVISYTSEMQIIQNCISTKNTTGFAIIGSSGHQGFFVNNISIGNVTTNWAVPVGSYLGSNNIGESDGLGGFTKGTPWTSASNPNYAMLTSDFAGYGTINWNATDSFYPASSTSPQADSGIDYFGHIRKDITDAEVPNYNNGGAEAVDIGAYEFDNGYGNHPASHVLTLDNVAVGSRVFIRDQADTVTHYDQIAAASTVTATITVYGDSRDNWRIKVRKASSGTTYIPYETLMTATPGSSSIYVSQVADE